MRRTGRSELTWTSTSGPGESISVVHQEIATTWPSFERTGLDWNDLSDRSRPAVDDPDAVAGLQRWVAQLCDGHTNVHGGLDTFSQTPLNRSGWTATASITESGSSPGNAIDGSGTSRWSTGTPQIPGQWFQVDMGANQTIGRVTIETRSSDRWDHPRWYQVHVSTDGSTWTQVADGWGSVGSDRSASNAVNARYVRITQTGTAPEWWTIGEINIYSLAQHRASSFTAGQPWHLSGLTRWRCRTA